MSEKLTGLIAATYTPLDKSGALNLDAIPAMVDRLIDDGVAGLYVCGSTGEGMSLTGEERRAVAERYVAATDRRVPVVVQVGHNSVTEAAQLAAHARQIGADVVSATPPSYFKVDSVDRLVDCMAEMAAGAADLPFYYYHIPSLTGVAIDMLTFLKAAGERIPNLAGIKYTTPTVHEYQACREFQNGRFDILWGSDEMLLSALVVGAQGAIGSTYNIAAPLYRALINAFAGGDLASARRWQFRSVEMIRAIYKYPFHAAMKEVLKMLGHDFGACRLPLGQLSPKQTEQLGLELEQIGFFDWGRNPT